MKKYYINLTEQERSQIIHSLIDKKNALTQGALRTNTADIYIAVFKSSYEIYKEGGKAKCQTVKP